MDSGDEVANGRTVCVWRDVGTEVLWKSEDGMGLFCYASTWSETAAGCNKIGIAQPRTHGPLIKHLIFSERRFGCITHLLFASHIYFSHCRFDWSTPPQCVLAQAIPPKHCVWHICHVSDIFHIGLPFYSPINVIISTVIPVHWTQLHFSLVPAKHIAATVPYVTYTPPFGILSINQE